MFQNYGKAINIRFPFILTVISVNAYVIIISANGSSSHEKLRIRFVSRGLGNCMRANTSLLQCRNDTARVKLDSVRGCKCSGLTNDVITKWLVSARD